MLCREILSWFMTSAANGNIVLILTNMLVWCLVWIWGVFYKVVLNLAIVNNNLCQVQSIWVYLLDQYLAQGFFHPSHQRLTDYFVKSPDKVRVIRPIWHWVTSIQGSHKLGIIVWKLQNGLKFSGPSKNPAWVMLVLE